ncbi:conjugal transfer protein TraW [Escherichia coli]|uniref:conjugal transfer protein TraW n=1 Tax=Escherichia coli TaxID=562 RepID=UPI0034C62921
MPSVSRYRTWLAVPADEIEDLKKAHPPMNGHTPVIWDKEHKLWFARPGADLSRLDRWLPRPQDVSMNGSDPVTEFAQVLENAGLVLKELPVMDGKIHRVPTADDKKGQKSGAYRGFLDGRPAGWYRDYRSADDSPITWTFSGGEQTDPRARLHLKAHSMQRREDAERELKAQYNRQAAYARRYINKWPQATAHEYLTRKGIQAAPGVRVNNKNELVIPFSNRNGAIRSYQRIPVTGGKDARILIDSEKTGTEAEYARFGGTAVCPSVGEIPGGDSQVRSIYHGAGTADTPAALTWDQKQIDAATAYMKNTSRPSAGRALGKGEVNTQSGRTYVGLQNEYNGIIDSASNPQLTLIADSTPNESTRKALAETLQSDSAAAYFDQVASPEAKARGYMSTREFEAFEAGRRYANTAYLVDLQEMQGDNLLRELVRITAQMNWQLNDLKEQIRQGNVISGQQLALTARQYYEKQLGSLEKTINQANAR